MKLFVRTVLDGIFPVEMDAHANVEQLKLAIQTVKNYEPSLQQLYVSGQRIDTDPKLCIAKINGLVESGFVICLLKLNAQYTSYMSVQELTEQEQKQVEWEKKQEELRQTAASNPYAPRVSRVNPRILANFQVPPVENIPVDTVALEFLLSMGFPEHRARKALILSHMKADEAAEWLLRYVEDPYADAPLTVDEIARFYPQLLYPPQGAQPPNPELLRAISLSVCTFCVTGDSFQEQRWYHCETCNMVQTKGICETCANTCHKGHKLSEAMVSSFFCDCGAGAGPQPCKSLHSHLLNQQEGTQAENSPQSAPPPQQAPSN